MIVDPTNPVAPDGNGGFQKIIGEQESSGQILAGLLPAGAWLVKAFGRLSIGSLSAAARREPEGAALFYAADDDHAGDLAADLIRIGGYEPVPVGCLHQLIRLEVYLNEFAAWGTISRPARSPTTLTTRSPTTRTASPLDTPRPQHCSQQASPTRTITSLTSRFAIARSKNSAGGSHVQHGAARSQQEART